MLQRAFRAMGTDVELLLDAEPGERSEGALDRAEAEFERLEQMMSRFREDSELSRLNRDGRISAASPDLVRVLKLALEAREVTGGRFDPTVHDAVVAAGYDRTFEAVASDAAAISGVPPARCGGDVRIKGLTIELEPGTRIDLGGIGKGYAVDQMAALLAEWSIRAALIHGGQSSLLAVGAPPGRDSWGLSLCDPDDESRSLGQVHARDQAVSSSGVSPTYRHVIDPRTGLPATPNDNAWAMLGSGTIADALTTAFLVMSPAEVEQYCGQHPDVSVMLLRRLPGGGREILRFGRW